MKKRLIWLLTVLWMIAGNVHGQDVSSPPWLRTALPEQALAYVRVPNLWGLLGSPKGSALNALQAADGNNATMTGLREGLQATWLTPLNDAWGPLPELLLNELSSPLEAAVLLGGEGPPRPEILVSGTLRAATVAEAKAILDSLVNSDERLQWNQILNAEGYGVMGAMGLPIQVRFQAPEQRLLLLSGMGLPPDALTQLSAQFQSGPEHPMHALESEIDASGQGLFAWINAAAATQIAVNMVPPPMVAIMQLSGAMDMQQLAFGMGVSAGKSRTKLIARMPSTGFRRFLPVPTAELSVKSVKGLETAGVFSLPSLDDWHAFKQLLQQLNPAAATELAQIEQDIQKSLGSSLEDWWQIFGPELVYISDAAGQYGALKIRDWPRFETLIQSLHKRFEFGLEQRQVGSETYTHLSIPSVYSLAEDEVPLDDGFLGIFMKLSTAATHAYWKREQDYLIVASLPQILLDRDTLEPQQSVGKWLAQQIRMPSDHAVLALATQAQGVPLLFYQWHLQMLQYLGDIVDKPVDLFSLPSPRQIELPASGGYGVQLASTPDRVELELVYETNPLELLFAGNTMTTIAVAGIAAAIAIPAYQDYTVRAEVSASFAEAQIVQTRVEAFFYQQGRMPSEDEFAEIATELTSELYALEDMYFDPASNTLSIILAEPIDVYGDALHFAAQVEAGTLSWQCSVESYQAKYYPAECQ